MGCSAAPAGNTDLKSTILKPAVITSPVTLYKVLADPGDNNKYRAGMVIDINEMTMK